MAHPEKGYVVVMGAGSPIGRAIGEVCAARGMGILLAGRRVDDLERTALDLNLRFGVDSRAVDFDALAIDSHADFVSRCDAMSTGFLEGFVWCVGTMLEEKTARSDNALRKTMIDTNFTGAISVLEHAAQVLSHQGRGFIIAVTSVAGDRGRASNGMYGATKAALSTYLSALRARLARIGVTVVDVKPGFVDTSLTHGRPGTFLVAPPERVALDALRGVDRDRAVVYTPWFWRAIMLVIRAVPDAVFKRLSL
jgi:decaprenylphospho-beta-D-erythro-pentofuranosid-2-ulose 2-reductase